MKEIIEFPGIVFLPETKNTVSIFAAKNEIVTIRREA